MLNRSNIIFLIEMKIIHICNFLTINFYEILHEYFFVRNQFLITKNEEKTEILYNFIFKMAAGSHLEFLKSRPYLE